MKIANTVMLMQLPSRLKQYPDGTTKPTVDFSQPSFSNLPIKRGKADSEDDVPSTNTNSSRMYLRNFHRLNPASRAAMFRTTKTKTKPVT
ncbi:hypothetical protein D3C84_1118750 [compost metagenome]